MSKLRSLLKLLLCFFSEKISVYEATLLLFVVHPSVILVSSTSKLGLILVPSASCFVLRVGCGFGVCTTFPLFYYFKCRRCYSGCRSFYQTHPPFLLGTMTLLKKKIFAISSSSFESSNACLWIICFICFAFPVPFSFSCSLFSFFYLGGDSCTSRCQDVTSIGTLT